MLKANKMARKGMTADFIYEVTDSGTAVATINDTRLTIDVGGRQLNIHREGIAGPTRQLKEGDTLIATAIQKPMFNFHTLAYDGREWTFKAIGMLALKYDLFQGDSQIGAVSSGSFMNRMKDITADLPAELPLEVQVFLLALAIHAWSQPAN